LKKQKTIKDLINPIFSRLEEYENRPQALIKAAKRLVDAKELIEVWRKNLGGLVEEDLNKFLMQLESTKNWLTEKIKEQETRDLTLAPVITISEIEAKIEALKVQLNLLKKKTKTKTRSKIKERGRKPSKNKSNKR